MLIVVVIVVIVVMAMVILVGLLLIGGCCRSFQKEVSVSQLDGLSFLSRFTIAPPEGSVEISYQYAPQKLYNPLNEEFDDKIVLAVVQDDKIDEYLLERDYLSRKKLSYRHEVLLLGKYKGKATTKVFIANQTQTHQWFFYLLSNGADPERIRAATSRISITTKTLNNGSYFSDDQQHLPTYLAFFLLWLFFISSHFSKITNQLIQTKRNANVAACVGMFLLGAAYFYKLVNLFLINYKEIDHSIFQLFSIILKEVAEGINTAIIIALAGGWSITHLKNIGPNAVVGFCGAILHAIACFFGGDIHFQSPELDHYHFVVLLGSRALLLCIFLVRVRLSLNQSTGRVKQFIAGFAKIGALYFLIYPMAFIFSRLFLSPCTMHEFVTFAEELVQFLCSAAITRMLVDPESTFRSLSINIEDSPLKIPHQH